MRVDTHHVVAPAAMAYLGQRDIGREWEVGGKFLQFSGHDKRGLVGVNGSFPFQEVDGDIVSVQEKETLSEDMEVYDVTCTTVSMII